MTKRIIAVAAAAAIALGLAAAPAQAAPEAPNAGKVTFSKMGWDWGGF